MTAFVGLHIFEIFCNSVFLNRYLLRFPLQYWYCLEKGLLSTHYTCCILEQNSSVNSYLINSASTRAEITLKVVWEILFQTQFCTCLSWKIWLFLQNKNINLFDFLSYKQSRFLESLYIGSKVEILSFWMSELY